MSENASKPKSNPFTIWTRPAAAAETAERIAYPSASPFTIWTRKPAPERIAYPSANPFTIWTKYETPATPIKLPANNAFTIWAGKAAVPAPAPAPAPAEAPVEAGAAASVPSPVAARVASIFNDDAGEATEEHAAPLGKTLMRWFVAPLVAIMAFIGFYQLDTERKELTEDKAALIGEKNTLIGEKEELSGELSSQKEANERLTEKKRMVENQLVQTELANKSLEEQAQDLKREIGSLKGDVTKLKGDLADAITRHAEEAKTLNATIKEKTETIEVKVAKIAELEKTLVARDETISKQEMALAARDKEIVGLNAAVTTANGRITELQEKTDMLSSELEGSLKKASDLTAMLTSANQKLEAMVAETTASAENLKKELTAMRAQTETLTAEKTAAEKRADEMAQKAAAAEAAAAEALKKAEELKNATTVSAAPAAQPPIFNGKDLTGWEGDPRLWSVVDGAIVGETNDADKKIGANTFLIWKGGEVGDFELTLKARVTGENNSGIQYRSRIIDPAAWVVGGYQMDMHPKPEYFGMLYEEKGRGIVAQRGQKVNVTAEGEKKVVGEIDRSKPFDITQWNEYTIIAKGNTITHKVNGDVTVELTDDQVDARAMKGVLAFQVHAGPAMKVEMKDIVLTSK